MALEICIDCGTPMTKDNYLSFFGDKASDIVKWDEEADPQDLTWFSDSDGNLVGYKTVI
jgi:hypothetical protein